MQLNTQQKIAVSHSKGPCIVTAVPGSGKTAVLTSRVIELVQNGQAEPRNILCLTFTNKAAEEMKSRIAHFLGEQSSQIWISTFHRLCLAILRKHGSLIDLPPNFSIYASKEQDELMTKLARMHEYETSRYAIQKLTKAVNDFREDIVDFEQHIQELNPVEASIIQDYQETLNELNAVDFSGMLYKAWLILKNNPAVGESMAKRFRYVLVDEFQDTNHVQYDIVQKIAIHDNLFVVADFNQSIYSFRGAKPQNLKRFVEEHKETKQITLPRNYRSTQPILQAAQNLIRNNNDAREVELYSDRGSGQSVRVSSFMEPEQESTMVVYNILSQRKVYGYDWKDFAILYRANSLSRSPEMALRNREIPYRVVGGFSFFDRLEIKTTMSYLALISNPHDTINFARAVTNPKRGVGDDTIGKLEKTCLHTGESILSASKKVSEIPKVSKKAQTNLNKFVEMIEKYRAQEGKVPLSVLTENLIKESGYYEQVKKIDEEEDGEKSRTENLEEFLSGIAEFEGRRPNCTVSDYLQSIQLLTNDIKDEEEDVVKLLTMHGAKGLEWSSVYVIGVESGMVPHSRSSTEEEIREERRLLYVAMTRAKDHLQLSYCDSRRRRMAGRSYFLDEIE